ncbi:MAG: MnhB domain-containing protein [Candidatus Thermoplasmatota archaeon]|nr:MnhB domain-containing protein [Candidatus Thermoplasmatota archaeon]
MKSVVVKTFGRALTPFILMYGIYLTLFGPISPGGGFQGGAVLASGVILVLVTHGKEEIERLSRHIQWFDSFGVFLFLIVGLIGIVIGRSFLVNLTPYRSATLILLDIVIALKVFAGLVALSIFFFEEGVERS